MYMVVIYVQLEDNTGPVNVFSGGLILNRKIKDKTQSNKAEDLACSQVYILVSCNPVRETVCKRNLPVPQSVNL